MPCTCLELHLRKYKETLMTQKNNKIQSACTIINCLSLLTDFETKSRDLGATM